MVIVMVMPMIVTYVIAEVDEVRVRWMNHYIHTMLFSEQRKTFLPYFLYSLQAHRILTWVDS